MAETRKVQLGASVNATEARAGFQEIKDAAKDMARDVAQSGQQASKGLSDIGAGATKGATQVDSVTRSFVNSIQRQIAVMEAGSKSSADYYRVLASQRGADLNVLSPYLSQLDAVVAKTARAKAAVVDLSKVTTSAGATPFVNLNTVGTSLGATPWVPPGMAEAVKRTGDEAEKAGNKFNQYGLSAKQTAQALRGVPAQLTDIVVGLQNGQAPLTVLLQQGGQLRDMFGGVAPAARALGGAVLGLINPFTVAAGAAAGLAVAYAAGSKEADVFAKALILSGDAAGATVGQMALMAQQIDSVIGTQAKAAEVLAQFASTGRVAAANLEEFTVTAIRLERVAGVAVADTVKQFADLGRSPVEASRRLNEQYNYLTLAVFEQIKALEEQGRATEAAELAQRTFADSMAERADKLTERLGYVERAWRAIKDAVNEAGDELLSVGRQSTDEQRLAQIRDQLTQGYGPFGGGLTESALQGLREEERLLSERVRIGAQEAQRAAERAAEQKAGIEAEKEIARIRQGSLTNQEKLTAELKKYREGLEAIRLANPNSRLLDPAQIARDEENIRKRYTDRPREFRDDAATRMLQQLREAEASARAQLTTQEKLTAAERQQAEFLQQIADLKNKAILTADQKSLLAAEEAIKAQLQLNVSVEREVKAREEAAKEQEKQLRALERFQQRAAQMADQIEFSNADRRAGFELEVAGFGLSLRQREQMREEAEVKRQFQAMQLQLQRSADPELLLTNPDYLREFEAAQQKIKSGMADALRDVEAGFAALDAAQSNWANGASEALRDYVDEARDAASQTHDLFADAFKGMEDALTEFVTTGKLDFESLVESILADVARINIQRGITGPLADWMSGLVGGGGQSSASSGGGIGDVLGSIFGPLFGGGRAGGGPVSAGRLYEINERGPEVLNVGGRQFLMMGSQGGTVTPNGGQGGRTIQVTVQVQAAQGMSRATALQQGAAYGEGIQRALARNT
jgi:lambda family phage tail tape measure protein